MSELSEQTNGRESDKVSEIDAFLQGDARMSFLFLAFSALMLGLFMFAYKDTSNAAVSTLPKALTAQIHPYSEPSARQRFFQSDGSEVVQGLTEDISLRIGLISGHLNFDPGAVCEDESNLYEVNVVNKIARLAEQALEGRGIAVDILAEYDDRLNDYRGDAVVSIHADMCSPKPSLTGYKSAAAKIPKSDILQTCINSKYGEVTQLVEDSSIYHITEDMTGYHAFNRVNPSTPIIILETGFLYNDRELLVEATLPAQAIAEGILCFLDKR